MTSQYRCANQKRVKALIDHAELNGIEYLEVGADQRTLKLFLINALALPFTGAVVIVGGVRVRGAVVETVNGKERIAAEGDLRVTGVAAAGKVLTVTVNQPGDFSTYTLRLVAGPNDFTPPSGIDRQLAAVNFSFKVDCPSDFDCAPEDDCPPEKAEQPEFTYLAKDYASFRRLMLDRLSVVLPGWQERNAADVGVALVELLAYVGDHLSYMQDAAATEAYLATAHRRVSVRRHARLLDYPMHEGSNARAWVCFEYAGADLPLPAGTQLLTRGASDQTAVAPAALPRLLAQEQPAFFETLHDIVLQEARSRIRLHTWGDEQCCLPTGATRATLVAAPGLALAPGDLLVFEEVLSPTTTRKEDADPTHRHAVRLTSVQGGIQDRLKPDNPVDVLEVGWAEEDALPFPLCISSVAHDAPLADVSLACANVALADHGRRVVESGDGWSAPAAGPFSPRLRFGPLTQQGRVRLLATGKMALFDPDAPAAAALRWEMRDVRPALTLRAGGVEWTPQADLLGSDRFATEFVAEVGERDTTLRFGDDVLGLRPPPAAEFEAEYRTGNGAEGNVGAGAISRVVTAEGGLVRVWNPLPAVGGVEPESIEQVKQYAPTAFRTQERAVTPADYVELTQRRSDVQKAAAQLRWTGSWYTAFVTVDRRGGLPVDARFEDELRGYLGRYRMAGVDLEITPPTFVPLDIELEICVKPGHFRADVKAALLEAFSSGSLPGGRRGFFHQDNFTFGQPLFLSRLYAAALAVQGVDTVTAVRFQRYARPAENELEQSVLGVSDFEILRLDNDPNFPENGVIDFSVKGGL